MSGIRLNILCVMYVLYILSAQNVPTGMYMASIMTDSGSSMQSILFHNSTMGVELIQERCKGNVEGK